MVIDKGENMVYYADSLEELKKALESQPEKIVIGDYLAKDYKLFLYPLNSFGNFDA